jgi:metal transporter CNNM
LKRKISFGDKEAKKVFSVRKRGNLLLCTLLLVNVGVNSALAVFLGSIANGFAAGLMATGLIVIFGEIIPQATFARFALKVGARTAWLVKIFIFILFPICWPVAWVLDKALGEEMQTIYSKKELMKIIEEHGGAKESDVDADEERIVRGALSFSDKSAESVMTPRTVVYALEINAILDKKLLDEIKKEGFTRIPVYRDSIDSIAGILYVKDLINIGPKTIIKSIYRKEKVLIVSKELKLDKLLDMFIKAKAHLACVKNEYEVLEGVVSLEDVIEEILKLEIMDETDKVPDLQMEAKKRARNKKV